MDNITSVIESFENGSFLTSNEANLSGILDVDVIQQLNEVILWLNAKFFPCAYNEIRKFDRQQLDDCFIKARLVKQKFSKLYKYMKTQKQLKQQSNYTFVCNTCKEEISLPPTNLWHNLQQHEHIEEALSNYNNFQNILVSSNLENPLNNNSDSLITPGNNKFSVSEQQNYLIPSSSSSPNYKYELPRNGMNLQKHVDSSKQTNYNNCPNCTIKNIENFKFNFAVSYSPLIEKKLYFCNDFARRIKDMEGLGLHTVQYKGPQLFTCLLCCCDVPSHVTFRTVKEHISGQRHTKKKVSSAALNALIMYHEGWIKCEQKYQAHQVHFLPQNQMETRCVLCTTSVPYEFLEDHINGNIHKGHIINFQRRDKSPFVQLQASVYGSEDVSINEQSDDSEEISGAAAPRSNQRRLANMDKAESESDDSDTNAVEDKKTDAQVGNSKGSTAVKAKPNHLIIRSIANPSGTELKDLLEHRFLPYLEAIQKLSDEVVECKYCKMRLPKVAVVVREHILSTEHLQRINKPYMRHHYFCEICGNMLKTNIQWFEHLKLTKHVEKCDKLGAIRKNKLAEHECITCKVVIFGDELSIKRHKKFNTRGVRYRRNKEIILGEAVKLLFGTENDILGVSRQLVTEANQVLFRQDQLQKCCRALEAALADTYPECKVYPFGSRVSGLGSEKSDLDVFVDVGDMYIGQNHQDCRSQEKFVTTACKAFRKKKEEFTHVNPIPTARTPIVQVYHISTRLDCDLSFRHGLSVENTKFLRLCIKVQPVIQPVILLLKQWLELCKLHENVTTYALSMMVIFHLQVLGHLKPVQELKQLGSDAIVIDGWGIVDFSNLNIKHQIVPYCGPIRQLLKEFFCYYGSFAYATDVVCPLLGKPIKKSLFTDKPKGEDLPLEMLSYVQKVSTTESEYFKARSPFCIQDPFDLSHNLAKACTNNLVEKFKTLCDLTYKYIRSSG